MVVRLVVPTSRSAAPERCHDIGDAEAVADFDQFAARDDGFAARGQFVEREKERGGVVVDRDARRAEQALDQAADVDVALAAAARGEIVFEVRVARKKVDGSPSGARPRLVCSTTPVALMTRRRDGRSSAVERPGGSLFDGEAIAASAADFGAGGFERAPDLRNRDGVGKARVLHRQAVPAPHEPTAGREVFRYRPRIRWYALVQGSRKRLHWKNRGVAQPGRAPGSGPGGRWFESTRPDQIFQ